MSLQALSNLSNALPVIAFLGMGALLVVVVVLVVRHAVDRATSPYPVRPSADLLPDLPNSSQPSPFLPLGTRATPAARIWSPEWTSPTDQERG